MRRKRRRGEICGFIVRQALYARDKGRRGQWESRANIKKEALKVTKEKTVEMNRVKVSSLFIDLCPEVTACGFDSFIVGKWCRWC